jgi:type II secretory pathway pseudopilin PulG
MLAALLGTLLAFAPQDRTRDEIIEADIQAAVGNLGSENYWDAAMARAELMIFGRRVVPALVAAHKKNSGGALDEDDRSIRVRYFVCEILGEVRADTDEAVDLLIEALKDRGRFGTTLVATAAAGSLGKLGSERAIGALLDALATKTAERDKIFLGEIVLALGNLRALQAAPRLLKMLERTDMTADEEPERQRARALACIAAEALGKIRSADAVNPLVAKFQAAVRDPLTDEPMETFVIAALRRIVGELAGKSDEEIRTWATERKRRLDQEEREKAAEAARAKTRERMRAVEDALEKCKNQKGGYPARLAELRPDWLDSDDLLRDGWGNDFSYKAPGTGGASFDLVSFGADGREWGAGPDEDLWNHAVWQPGLIERAKELLRKVGAAVDQYRADQGRLPIALSDLFRKPAGAAKWPANGYLPDLVPDLKDPFGAPLKYEARPEGSHPYTLKSLGMDREPGGEGIHGDISVWDLGKK